MNESLVSGPLRWRITAASLLTLLALPAQSAMAFDAARLNEIAARLPPQPAGFGRPISDRAAWEKLARAAAFGRIVSRAESLTQQPTPPLADDLYDSKVLNSYGHAVPVIAGQLQRPGADAKAVVLRSDFTDGEDTLTMDIRSAYPVPELERLERTFTFRRIGVPELSVRDEVAFREPKSFETALVTWGEWKRLSEKELMISDDGAAVRVQIETGGIPFELRWKKLDEDVPTPKKPMRLGIALNSPVKAATVALTIQPAANRQFRLQKMKP